MNQILLDDCLNRFYICTDKSIDLPENNIDCHYHFEKCFEFIKNNSKVIASRFEAPGNTTV